jgi:hypothetical protein
MGAFVSRTAFRTNDAAAVSAAIHAYVIRHGVACEPGRVGDDFSASTLVFAPRGGWTVVSWPDAFVGWDIAAVEALTAELGLLASLVFVADGKYWAHVLVERGEIVDEFCSHPQRLHGESTDAWRGNPELLARKFGVEAADLAPYLVDLDAAAEAAKPAPPKGFWARMFAPEPPPFHAGPAFADDEYDLDDYDVCVDFWRRAGIHWPEAMELANPAFCWRFADDFGRNLPH